MIITPEVLAALLAGQSIATLFSGMGAVRKNA